MSNSIAGRVVVITDASSGLGEATARPLSAQGASVVLGARRVNRLQALADEHTGGAVYALSQGRRQDVKPYNIRTTVISPAAVEILFRPTRQEL